MATEKHTTKTDKYGNKLTHIKSNNPSRNNTTSFKPAAQPSVHSTMPSVVKTHKPVKPIAKIATKTPPVRAATTARKIKSSVKLPHSDKRTKSALPRAVSHSPVLVAEFLLAILIIGFNGFSDIARNGYQTAMSGVFLRFTAVSGVFFVLFLLSGSKRGSTVAALFGGLVDLGILFNAVNKGAISDLTSVITGGGLPSTDKVTLLSDLKPNEYYETAEADTHEGPVGIGSKATLD